MFRREWVIDTEQIELARARAGLAKAELACGAGVSVGTVTRACGDGKCTPETVRKVCLALKLRPKDVIISQRKMAVRQGIRQKIADPAVDIREVDRSPDPMLRHEDLSPWPAVDLNGRNRNLPP